VASHLWALVVYIVSFVITQSVPHSYSKEENLDVQKLQTFTFLLIPASDYKLFQNTHKPLKKVNGFSKIKVNWKKWILLDFIVEEKIYVVQQRIVSCQY